MWKEETFSHLMGLSNISNIGYREKKEIYQLAPHPGKKEENSQKPISGINIYIYIYVERIQDMIRSETPYFKAPVGLNSHRANINSHRTNQIVPLPENMEEDDEEPGNSSTKSDLTVEKINIKDILSFSSKCMNYSFSRLLRRFDSVNCISNVYCREWDKVLVDVSKLGKEDKMILMYIYIYIYI